MRSRTGFNGPYGLERPKKIPMGIYLPEEKEELKLNILKALQKNPFLTKDQLRKEFYVGKFMIEETLEKCRQEGLIMRLRHKGKVLTRRGLEYLDSNY